MAKGRTVLPIVRIFSPAQKYVCATRWQPKSVFYKNNVICDLQFLKMFSNYFCSTYAEKMYQSCL